MQAVVVLGKLALAVFNRVSSLKEKDSDVFVCIVDVITGRLMLEVFSQGICHL